MLLYIVRHADAGDPGDPRWADDSLRPLSRKGRKQFARMVKKLTKRGFAPACVASSPYVRARQTADIILERLPESSQVVELGALAPGGELSELVAWTQEQAPCDVAWVGHAPDVNHLLESLLGKESGSIALSKGAIAAVEFDGGISSAGGQLLWLVTPKLLGN